MKKPMIFFDWDGTLADSMGLSRHGVQTAMAAMGLPPVAEEMLVYSNGPTIEESAQLLGVPESMQAEWVRTRYAAEMDGVDEHQRAFAGVPEMLRRLRDIADLVIISNGGIPYLTKSTRILGVADCFFYIQGIVVGQTKGVTLSQVIDRLQPERAVMVGDRLGDFLAGKHCHIPAIAAGYGYGNEEEWAQADVMLPTVEALEAWLTDWAKADR